MNDVELVKRVVAAAEGIRLVLGSLYISQTKDLDQRGKAACLERCGFATADIAKLLGTTDNNVRVLLHRVRKGANKRGARKDTRRK